MNEGEMAVIPAADFDTPPTVADNANHPPVDDKWWQESGLFTFASAADRFGCWIRFGAHANQGVANLYSWTMIGDEMADRRMMVDQPLPPGDLLEATIAGASVTTIEPLMRYGLTLDTDELQLRLEWRNFRHPLSMSFNVGGATIAKGHYNAMGRATGTGVWRGREFPIDAAGFSDHSWGARRKHLPASRSLFCVFDEDFYITAIPVSTGPARSMVGYVYKDGVLGRLQSESKMGYSFRDDWITPAGCEAELIDDKGRVFHLSGRTFGPSSTWPMGHGKLVTHASAGFRCEGREGSGILESSQYAGLPPSVATLGLDPASWWINEQTE
ncbi:hypothetical protein [Sphingobium sp. EM0848]|uniref:DUF7064 domain-containing protein n=1 Tax=Sphingobium sp. EM0848 TaxID=2743473 RepID=UPI00159C2C61|nr:hypothetical protein [Sphingobium sp. EM0848]